MARAVDTISERDFRRLTQLIGSECGIALAPAKRITLESRLRKRVRVLGLPSLTAYCDYIHTDKGREREWPGFIDAITTHKTDFFREPSHFEYLVAQVIPELARGGAGVHRPVLIWSAACSTGEEPWTVAMVLSHAVSGDHGCRFRIWATDISIPVLETARRAVYRESVIDPVPEAFRRRYLLRSRNRHAGVVRIAPEIRALVEFRQLNLMDEDYGFAEPLDIVFCRNVMIYFERRIQERVLNRIAMNLRRGGFLLMGHSESLNGLDLPLIQVAPAVYRRANG
ncbi:MAG TPA: protein-glutamate O-methyltransferase [Bryobacteraceae bacterium]|nr:protein-glutamate O-methyltransferase [Bryobacteraceae bacterium]